MQPISITRYFNVVQGDMDLSITGDNPLHVHYGGNPPTYASTVDYDIGYSITNQVYNADRSITITLQVVFSTWVRTATGGPGVTANIYAVFDGSVVWNFSNNTGTSTTVPGTIRTITYTIPPLSSVDTNSSLLYTNNVPTGETNTFYVGFRLYNPNPPDYRPGSVMNNGQELSCNRSGGWNSVMNNGVEVECRTMNGHQEGGNPPTAMVTGQELNQLKVGQGG